MKLHKVILVDDESIIRDGLRKHVRWEELGLEVVFAAEDAESALEFAVSTPPDILITDIRMKGNSGLQLIAELVEREIRPQVILLSSYNNFSYAQEALKLLVVREYLLKPVDLEYLHKVLRETKQKIIDDENKIQTELIEGKSITEYKTFLQTLFSAGYDKDTIIHSIKMGCFKDVEVSFDIIVTVAVGLSIPFSLLKHFFTNFIFSLISCEVLDETLIAELNPIEILEKCKNNEHLFNAIRDLTMLICKMAENKHSSVKSRLIASSLRIIDSEFDNVAFNLKVLAARLHVAPNYLSTRFKEEVGVGFMKYRMDKQMQKAQYLLRDPSYKIYDISNQVGFQDEKYFAKQFKRYSGNTPKDYRNKIFDITD